MAHGNNDLAIVEHHVARSAQQVVIVGEPGLDAGLFDGQKSNKATFFGSSPDRLRWGKVAVCTRQQRGSMGGRDFKTRVLVVDDEPIILETMTAILESEGFVVRAAEDGFAALVTLRQTPPDIIISDLRMPNMSGFEFLSVVRRRFPHIPVIAISGEYVAAGLPPGLLVDAILQKGGYTQQQLFETIRRLINDSPIRPHSPKCDHAPLWIPRRNADYIVASCTDCLRSFPVDDDAVGEEVREAECPFCGIQVRYMVDSAVLSMLEQRRKRLPEN